MALVYRFLGCAVCATALVLVHQASAAAQGAKRPAGRVTYPKLVRLVKAPYPEVARKAGLQGIVLLHVTVSDTGRVTAASVVRPLSPALDAAALAAVRQFVYKPATVDGKAVTARIKVAYPFRLTGVRPAPTPPRRKARPAPVARPVPRTRPVAKRRPPPVRPRPVSGAVVAGTVHEKGTRKGIEDAEVVVIAQPTSDASPMRVVARAHTGTGGRFTIPTLIPGRYVLEVRAAGCRRFRVKERLLAGARLKVRYYVERLVYGAYETVVTGRAEQREVTRYSISLPEIQKIPGTQGDALKAIQNMPGVARSPFGIGLLIVRGSAPQDTRVYLEGHEIPLLYHFLGITSVVNSDLLRRIDFVPGNFSVRYGRATGGAIDIFTRRGKRDGWHGSLDVDLWDVGALVEGPVGEGSLALSLRRSHIDAVLAVVPNVEIAPAYYDYQAIFDHPLWGGRLKVLALGSDDRLRIKDREADRMRTLYTTYFHKALAIWGRRWSKHEVRASLTGGFTHTSFGFDEAQKQQSADVGWRLEHTWRPLRSFALRVGHQGRAAYQTAEGFGIRGQDDEGVGGAPGTEGSDRISGWVIGQSAYLEATWKPVPRWVLIPGVRLDYVKVGPYFGKVAVDPRFTTRVDLLKKRLFLKAAVGLYQQEPQLYEIIKEVWGNPDLDYQRMIHASLGLSWQIRPSLSMSVTGFYKHGWNLVTWTDDFVEVDGELTEGGYTNDGLGRVYGGELLLKKNADSDCPGWLRAQKCFGWISYTLMRSERKDHPGDPWRLFTFDQTHILTAVLSVLWARGWQVGVRFRLTSGNPTTGYSGGLLDTDYNYYIPVTNRPNGDRLPLFHQLDLRVDKKWVFKKWMFSLYLDIQNVYNYQATEFLLWNFNYTRSGTLNGLPIIPSLGLKGEF